MHDCLSLIFFTRKKHATSLRFYNNKPDPMSQKENRQPRAKFVRISNVAMYVYVPRSRHFF